MQLHIVIAVLISAFFHAGWNSLIKGGKDTLLDSMLISVVWVVICVLAFPFLPLPDASSWLYIAVRVVIHVSYFLLLSKCYQTGELSRVYPIIRDLPPMIVALISFFILKEDMSSWGWVGVVTISAGIAIMNIG